MDVTRADFEMYRPEIEYGIETCCFAAIDCEFTGLVLPRPFHPLDTTAERYSKLREGVSKYVVLQLGLSFWDYNVDGEFYHVKTFNFYVFPDGADHETFWSEASSIRFLVQHGFDLNRCVREGVGYMRPAEFEERRAALRERQVKNLKAVLPESFADRIETVLEGKVPLEDLLKATDPAEAVPELEQPAEQYLSTHRKAIEGWLKGTKNDLVLPACNEMVRVAFYRHMERVHFNESFEMEAVRAENKEQAQQGLKKVRLLRSETTPIGRVLLRQKRESDELRDRYGITSLLTLLSKSRKPVVLHNSLRDLLHIVSQFFAPLPEDYADFQSLCKEIFPTVFDTKFMTSIGVLKQFFRVGRLADLYSQIRSQKNTFPMPTIVCPDGYGYVDATREHEAGYDAYMTGYIFAALSQFTLPNKKDCFCKLDAAHENLVPFRNKVPFSSSLDISCLDLDLAEETLQRNNVFVVEWSKNEQADYARSLVAQSGGSKKIGYGERVLAFIPNNPQQCQKMVKAHDLSCPPNCHFYKHIVPDQQQGQTPAPVTTPAKGRFTRRRNSTSTDATRSPSKIVKASVLPQHSPEAATSAKLHLTQRKTGPSPTSAARNSDKYHWKAPNDSAETQPVCPDLKKRRVEENPKAAGTEPFVEMDW